MLSVTDAELSDSSTAIAAQLGRGLADLCAIIRSDHAALRRIGGPDWEGVASAAVQHGMAPILIRQAQPLTREWPIGSIEKDALLGSLEISRRNCASLVACSQLITRALDSAGIPCIVLKGLHLALAYYDHPVLRSMGDIDLLVEVENLDRARLTLIELGYLTVTPRGRLSSPGHHHYPPLVRPNSLPVELHYALQPASIPIFVDVRALWRRSIPLHSRGVQARALCPEDLLLHLCIHTAASHLCRVPLRSLYDIVLVAKRMPLDSWSRLVSNTELAGASHVVDCALRLARELLCAPVPEVVFTALPQTIEFDTLRGHAMYQLRAFSAEAPRTILVATRQLRLERTTRMMFRGAHPVRCEAAGASGFKSSDEPFLSRAGRHLRLVLDQVYYVARLLLRPSFARQQWQAARVQGQLAGWIRARP